MSEVVPLEDGSRQFHLLRCSTNFEGPTEGFNDVDKRLLSQVNSAIDKHLPQCAHVNHVLAQLYHNSQGENGGKSTKAKIKRHADKTKDMEPNGVIAFASFYSFPTNVKVTVTEDDILYGKNQSVLTRLHFAPKDTQRNPFTVTLLPNSLLLIPLTTNQLYTHETKPSILPANKIPTRIGYVMRCSKQLALHRNGQTYVQVDNNFVPMPEMTPNDAQAIKEVYKQENVECGPVHYPSDIHGSFNKGDYLMPSL